MTAAPQEDLLGILLDLRTSLDVLNVASQDVWSTQRLEQLEQQVRHGDLNGTIREEIATLARAVYDCGLQHTRHLDQMEVPARDPFCECFLFYLGNCPVGGFK